MQAVAGPPSGVCAAWPPARPRPPAVCAQPEAAPWRPREEGRRTCGGGGLARARRWIFPLFPAKGVSWGPAPHRLGARAGRRGPLQAPGREGANPPTPEGAAGGLWTRRTRRGTRRRRGPRAPLLLFPQRKSIPRLSHRNPSRREREKKLEEALRAKGCARATGQETPKGHNPRRTPTPMHTPTHPKSCCRYKARAVCLVRRARKGPPRGEGRRPCGSAATEIQNLTSPHPGCSMTAFGLAASVGFAFFVVLSFFFLVLTRGVFSPPAQTACG